MCKVKQKEFPFLSFTPLGVNLKRCGICKNWWPTASFYGTCKFRGYKMFKNSFECDNGKFQCVE